MIQLSCCCRFVFQNYFYCNRCESRWERNVRGGLCILQQRIYGSLRYENHAELDQLEEVSTLNFPQY